MQQLLHVFYMSIFILNESKSMAIKIENMETNFIDFYKSMLEGKINLYGYIKADIDLSVFRLDFWQTQEFSFFNMFWRFSSFYFPAYYT